MIILQEKRWAVILNLATSNLTFIYEIFQIRTNGFLNYFSSVLNGFDFFGHLSGIIWLSIRVNSGCDDLRLDYCQNTISMYLFKV